MNQYNHSGHSDKSSISSEGDNKKQFLKMFLDRNYYFKCCFVDESDPHSNVDENLMNEARISFLLMYLLFYIK